MRQRGAFRYYQTRAQKRCHCAAGALIPGEAGTIEAFEGHMVRDEFSAGVGVGGRAPLPLCSRTFPCQFRGT